MYHFRVATSHYLIKISTVWMRESGAVGLVTLTGLTLPYVSATLSVLLAGYALAVLLALWISRLTLTIVASGVVAALFAGYNLPPYHSFVVAAPYRLGYGLFVGACAIISLYRPARGLLRSGGKHSHSLSNPGETKTLYSEANLPTLATRDELALTDATHQVAGTELYRWIRECAHLRNQLWNLEEKLREGDTRNAHFFLKEAQGIADTLRQQMQEAGGGVLLSTPLPPTPQDMLSSLRQNTELAVRLPEIYFLHIPKTAGSSLNLLLHDVYPPEQYMPQYEWRELLTRHRDEIASYRCYTGHYGTSLYSLLGRDIPTVTLLRDPFERCVSQLKHSERYRQAAGGLSPSVMRPHLRKLYFYLWEHIQYPALRQRFEARYVIPLLKEHQTLSLGMDIDTSLLHDAGERFRYRERLHGMPSAQDTEGMLERAKRRLDRMVVVGTTERFAESLELICDYLGVPMPPTLPQTNVGPGHSVGFCYRTSGLISSAMTARIDEITRCDRELYAYANDLLDKRWAQYQQRKQHDTEID